MGGYQHSSVRWSTGSFPVRVQEVAVTSDRHAPQGAATTTSDPAGDGGADHLTGRVLDKRYRVGPRIARGGMATVLSLIHI